MTSEETKVDHDWLKNRPPVVSREEWDAAHRKMREKEKAVMRARDELAAERDSALPLVGMARRSRQAS